MLEIFYEAEIVSLSKKGQAKLLDKMYEEAKRVSLGQLKKNRFKHVKACREVENYSGDHKFTDKNGVSHSFAVGPISTDGNGEKRAYGHIITGELQSSALKCRLTLLSITGSQHCTVVISAVTAEPIAI